MKRFWVVLVTLGLMVVFSASAMAVDLKFSGEYYAAGMYLDKTSLRKDVADEGPSTAFFYQRLRVQTDFIVSPGLILVTRFDAMERAWGAARSATMVSDGKGGFVGAPLAADSAGTVAENENIAFDWVYVDYKSPIGRFSAGYMNDGSTGTIFGNSYSPKPRIKYSYTIAPVTLNLAYTKEKEKSTLSGAAGYADADNDKYGIEGVFNWKNGKAGLNVNYYNYREKRPAMDYYKRTYLLFTPYAIAKIGPVALQAELNYLTGDQKYEYPSTKLDIDLQGISGWVDATADFKMFYVGGSIAYVSGDDNGTANKNEGFSVTGGRDWQPCLIMWNYERTNWAGALTGYDATAQDTNMTNGWLFQVRGGVRPVDKLDIMAAVSYARADKPNTVLEREYGYEVDMIATYKITNNLSYMLGVGYLFAGDYYKGTSSAHQINDDFLVINKLTLTF